MKPFTTLMIGVGLLTLPLSNSVLAESMSGKTGDKTIESDQSSSGRSSSESDQRRSRGPYPGLEEHFSDQSGQSGGQTHMSDQRQSMKSDSDSDSQGTKDGQLKPARGATKPGETDITNTKGDKGSVPSKYTILPVARGKKVEVDNGMVGSSVKSAKGEELGSIEELIMDSETKRIEYAMIKIGDTEQLKAFPWSSFKVDKKSGDVVLNMTKEQLQPGLMSTDQSPDLSDLEKQLQTLREQEARKGPRPGIGITNEPAAGGPHGESEVGGEGPAGPRALPPGEAPGFKHGK